MLNLEVCRFADSLANSSDSIASTTSATPGSGRSVGDMSELSSAADGAEYATKQAALASGKAPGPQVQAWPSGITTSLYLQIGEQTQTVPQAPQIVLPPGASTRAAQEAACNEDELEEEEEENELQQETQPQEQPAPEESNGSGTWQAGAADGELNGSNSNANESDANEELADERDEPDFQDEDDGHMIIHRGQIIAHKCMPIDS